MLGVTSQKIENSKKIRSFLLWQCQLYLNQCVCVCVFVVPRISLTPISKHTHMHATHFKHPNIRARKPLVVSGARWERSNILWHACDVGRLTDARTPRNMYMLLMCVG